MVVARWESRGGKHWVEAEIDPDTEYGGYRSNSGGGTTGTVGRTAAIAAVKAKVDAGYFLPDAAKTPMREISVVRWTGGPGSG